jgi:hypothetical protein
MNKKYLLATQKFYQDPSIPKVLQFGRNNRSSEYLSQPVKLKLIYMTLSQTMVAAFVSIGNFISN